MALVFNAGIPGDTTRELLARFERDVAARQPTLVILWVGGNDTLYPGHTVPGEEFQANYQKLCAKVQALGAGLLVGTLTPVITEDLYRVFPAAANHPLPPEERLAETDRIIRNLGIPLVDFAAVVRSHPVAAVKESYLRNQENSGMHDGLHLTPEGCRAAAEAALSAIRANRLSAERVVCFGDSLTHGVYLRGKGKAEPGLEPYPAVLAELLS